MIKYLYDHIVDYAIVNSVFNVHREVSIGKFDFIYIFRKVDNVHQIFKLMFRNINISPWNSNKSLIAKA